MKATIIDKTNLQCFEAAIPEELKTADLLIGAVSEEKAAGVLCVSFEGEEVPLFRIRYLYVIKEERRKGAGTAMIRFLKELAAEREGAAFTVECLLSQEEDPTGKFFESLGFTQEGEDYPVFSFPISTVKKEAIEKMVHGAFQDDANAQKGKKLPALKTKALSDATEQEWNELKNPFSMQKDFFDPDVSQILYEDKKPSGCILYRKTPSGYILKHLGNTAVSRYQSIVYLLGASCDALLRIAKPQTLLTVCADRPGTGMMLQQILSGKPVTVGFSRYYIA